MSNVQLLLNIAAVAVNGLVILTIGWFIDRRRARLDASGYGIFRATMIVSILVTGLWFSGLFIFGGRVNLYGTALMGGGAIAMLGATILYRWRRSRPAHPRADALRDTFS